MKPRVLENYKERVLPDLVKHFNYDNPMQAPRLEKIVLNMGLGEAVQNAKVMDGARVNFVNNVFIAGPQTAGRKGCIFPGDPAKGTKVYVSGNVTPLSPTGAENQWPNVTFYEQKGGRWLEHHPAPVTFRAAKPFPAAKVTTHTAKDAYDLVLTHAGAKVRDADDLRIINEVKTRTGRSGRTGAAAHR